MCRALAQPSAHPHPVPHPLPHAQCTPSWLTQPRAAKVSQLWAGERQTDADTDTDTATVAVADTVADTDTDTAALELASLLATLVATVSAAYRVRNRRRQHFAIKRISVTSRRSSTPHSCSNERENASFSTARPLPELSPPLLSLAHNRLISHGIPELWLDRIICLGLSSWT